MLVEGKKRRMESEVVVLEGREEGREKKNI